jgi:hypothetical protein
MVPHPIIRYRSSSVCSKPDVKNAWGPAYPVNLQLALKSLTIKIKRIHLEKMPLLWRVRRALSEMRE